MHDHNIKERNFNEDDRVAVRSKDNTIGWTSIIIGGVIIGFFAFILFYQDSGKVAKSKPSPTPSTQSTNLNGNEVLPESSQLPPESFDKLSQIPTIPSSMAIPSSDAISQAANEPSETETADAIDAARAEYKEEGSQALIDKVIVVPEPKKVVQKSAQPQHINKKMFTKPVAKKAPSINGNYTIQLLAVANQRSLQYFINANHLAGKVHHYTIVKNGKTLYVITYGSYKNIQAARAAVKTLPINLKQAHPWPKMISSLR